MYGNLKIAGLLIAALILGGGIGRMSDRQPTTLTFIAVGQGDCAVFQTAGRTVLIDVGPGPMGGDAGRKIVLPDLRKMGIDEIDLILLSHPDVDHVGGLAALVKGIPIGTIGISSGFAHFEPMLNHLRDANWPLAKTMWLGPEQTAQIGDFTLQVYCPSWQEPEPDNDGSEFVKITGDGSSAVFTGDGSIHEESAMTPGHDWHAQVLKLGHHGSKTASGEAWLENVHPEWAIISCGRNNRYGHPHQEVVDRVGKLGIKIARTDLEGDITFNLGPQGWVRAK